MSTPEGPSQGETPKAGAPTAVLLGIAIALLIGYAVTVFALFEAADNSTVTEPVWSRYIYLLGGLEAIVFTAVGWLFGREVNRKQAEQAEAATNEAKAAKKEASDAKVQGNGLKQAILTSGTSGLESPNDPLGSLKLLAQQTQF